MERYRWPADASQLIARAEALVDAAVAPHRFVLGVAGAPASGKSTIADTLVAELARTRPDRVALIGMDAFHLGHDLLVRRGDAAVKGAPRTFDVGGYMALLRRLRAGESPVFAPCFRREIEDSIAASVEVSEGIRLIITEGNYLLLTEPPWDQIRDLLNEAWYVELDDDVRQAWLTTRHMRYGRDLAAAQERTLGSDEANAVLIRTSLGPADVWIDHATPEARP